MSDSILKCSTCECDFDIDAEGGINGVIGTFITVAFCPTCYNGIVEMVEMCGPDWCEEDEE